MGILGDKVSNKRNVRLCSGSQLEGTVIMGGGVEWLITLHRQSGSTERDPEPQPKGCCPSLGCIFLHWINLSGNILTDIPRGMFPW